MPMTDTPLAPAAVKFDERFLDASWGWLTDPEIRGLTSTPVFTREQQKVWFHSLPTKTDYCIWGIELQDVPIGAFGFKHIQKDSAEYWGYIGDRGLWGRGIGRWMLQEAIERAKLKGLQRLYLHVVERNLRAIRLYRRQGFVEAASDSGMLRMEKRLCP